MEEQAAVTYERPNNQANTPKYGFLSAARSNSPRVAVFVPFPNFTPVMSFIEKPIDLISWKTEPEG